MLATIGFSNGALLHRICWSDTSNCIWLKPLKTTSPGSQIMQHSVTTAINKWQPVSLEHCDPRMSWSPVNSWEKKKGLQNNITVVQTAPFLSSYIKDSNDAVKLKIKRIHEWNHTSLYITLTTLHVTKRKWNRGLVNQRFNPHKTTRHLTFARSDSFHLCLMVKMNDRNMERYGINLNCVVFLCGLHWWWLIYTTGWCRERKGFVLSQPPPPPSLSLSLQWKQANPLLSTRQQPPSSHAVKYVDSHTNLPVPKQARFSTTSKFISALYDGHTQCPLYRLYAARWIPHQHLVVAVNVPPSWHLGFAFFQLWTMAKLTYNLLRLL